MREQDFIEAHERAEARRREFVEMAEEWCPEGGLLICLDVNITPDGTATPADPVHRRVA